MNLISRRADRIQDRLSAWWRGGAAAISPTAHYTGYVWAAHGLGDPGLATAEGRILYHAGGVVRAPLERLGGPTLEHFLLARHRILDHLLRTAIEDGRVSQVVELACGMSPRGLLLGREFGSALTYVEVDLPAMATAKRAALARLGAVDAHHRVQAADAFSAEELGAVFATLDPDLGVAVVSEGLLNYFPTPRVEQLWAHVAGQLQRFPHGLYLSDLHLGGHPGALDRAFAASLGVFVRGRVHFHYESPDAAIAALHASGFASGMLHAPVEYAEVLPGMRATGADRVRVVEARTSPRN